MRLSAALIGGLAILSAALPSNDDTKRSSLTLVERGADVAVPVIGSSLEPVSLEFEKRKGGSHGGSGHSNSKPITHKVDHTTKKSDPKPTSTKQPKTEHTTSKDEHSKTSSSKTKSTHSSTSHTSSTHTTSHTTSHTSGSVTSSSRSSSSHSSTSGSATGSITSHTSSTTATSTSSSTLSTSTLIPSATSNAELCGPSTCEAKDSCPLAYETGTTPSKKTTTKRFTDAVSESARSIYFRAARLVGRAGTINLSGQNIEDARAAGKANPSESTGTDRYLRLGGPVEGKGKTARTPNDQIFDSWDDSSFYRTIDGLRGCMAVMVTSPKGIFSVHLWETIYSPRVKGGLEHVLDVMKNGAKDQPIVIGKKTIPGEWSVKDQFGLSNYGAGKVAPGAWSDKDDIHIAIMAPSKDTVSEGTSTLSGVHPKSDWAGVLKYPTAANQLVSAIQSVVGNVPDERISLYAYKQYLDGDASLNAGTNGVMTAYVKDGVYAVYGETTKLFEVPIKPGSSSGSNSGGDGGNGGNGNDSDCDDSKTCTGSKCCVVQK